jgi:hypothetical protein
MGRDRDIADMSLDFLFGFGLAVVIIGMAGALLLAQARYGDLERENVSLREQLANVGRAKNRLYREALEDVGFAASQGALRVRALRSQMEDELAVIEAILNREPK